MRLSHIKGVVLRMKRLLANLALGSILGIFALPFAASLQQSGPPTCCLPGGKHHCTQKSQETGFKSRADTCPYASKFLAAGVAGVRAGRFEVTEPTTSGFVPTTRTCAGHGIEGRQVSDRGPPDLPC